MATGALMTRRPKLDALFWWEPGSPASNAGPTLPADAVAAACSASSADFLGRGSFGETWRIARADGPRAVKVVLDDQYPKRLLDREVRGLQRVRDDRVVALNSVEMLDLPVGKRPALVFEFVDGGDVAGRLQRGQWPTAQEVHAFTRGLLTGVAALHAVDTVHRDIKPENVALRAGAWDTPVLLDLGLAKLLSGESLTQYPALMGTFPFMAPEQVRQEPARKAADVWAVGVVAFTLLARTHPFYDGRNQAVLSADALQRLARGPRPLPGSVPEPLASVVPRLLSFEPHQRGSAARALNDLRGGNA